MIPLILLLSVVILLFTTGVKKGLASWSKASRLLEQETQRERKPNYWLIAQMERELWEETWHHGNGPSIRCQCDSCSMVTKLKAPPRPSGYDVSYYGYGIGNEDFHDKYSDDPSLIDKMYGYGSQYSQYWQDRYGE